MISYYNQRIGRVLVVWIRVCWQAGNVACAQPVCLRRPSRNSLLNNYQVIIVHFMALSTVRMIATSATPVHTDLPRGPADLLFRK